MYALTATFSSVIETFFSLGCLFPSAGEREENPVIVAHGGLVSDLAKGKI